MYIPSTDTVGEPPSRSPWKTEEEERIELMYEAEKRAAREAYDKYVKACSGVRVLRQLRKKPPDPLEEHGRVKRKLEAAERSGSAAEIAKARCEERIYWWEQLGNEMTRRAYARAVKDVEAAEDQLKREQFWLQRWRCNNWPPNVRQPYTVKKMCEKQNRKVKVWEDKVKDARNRLREAEGRLLRPRIR